MVGGTRIELAFGKSLIVGNSVLIDKGISDAFELTEAPSDIDRQLENQKLSAGFEAANITLSDWRKRFS
jgi:hypothetical protein